MLLCAWKVGKHYLDEGWKQQLMTVSGFIDQHVVNQSGNGSSCADAPGYLAQHQLFDQVRLLPHSFFTSGDLLSCSDN